MRTPPRGTVRTLLAAWLLAVVATAQTPVPTGPAPALQPVAPPAEQPVVLGAPAIPLGVFFWHDSPNDDATWRGLQQGLADLRLPVAIVERRAGGDRNRALAQLDELRGGCRLIVALGTDAALLCKERVPDVPVVFAAVSNAVASGIVADWNGSGRNLCGASNWIPPGAVLDVFQLAVPGLQRLGMLRSQASGVVSNAELLAMREHLAQQPRPPVQLVEAVAKDAADLPRAVTELRQAGVDAIWIPIDLTVYQNLAAVRQALGERPLPLVTTAAAGVRGGALVGATVDYALHGRRAATLVHAVLVGGKAPGTLPIDRMRSATVVVNVAAARAAGTELPLSLLLLADELLAAEAKDGKPAR